MSRFRERPTVCAGAQVTDDNREYALSATPPVRREHASYAGTKPGKTRFVLRRTRLTSEKAPRVVIESGSGSLWTYDNTYEKARFFAARRRFPGTLPDRRRRTGFVGGATCTWSTASCGTQRNSPGSRSTASASASPSATAIQSTPPALSTPTKRGQICAPAATTTPVVGASAKGAASHSRTVPEARMNPIPPARDIPVPRRVVIHNDPPRARPATR